MSMRVLMAGLLAAVFAGPCAAADVQSAPQFGSMPIGVAAQMNLGSAGLLAPFYSDEYFGLSQNRTGAARTGIAAKQNGAWADGYKDNAYVLVTAVNALVQLNQQIYLNTQVSSMIDDGMPNHVELDGITPKLSVGLMVYPDVDSMIQVSAFGEKTNMETNDTDSVSRTAWGMRIDGVRKLTKHWGVVGRLQFSPGDSTIKTVTSYGLRRQVQSDNRFYSQADIVGQYRHQDLSLIPEGWVLYPNVGANLLRAWIGTTTSSLGDTSSGVLGSKEDYGMVWGKLNLSLDPRPNRITPNVVVGLEHEWVNDLSTYTDETNYAMAGAGLQYSTMSGQVFNVIYGLHQGFNDNRRNQTLAVTASLSF